MIAYKGFIARKETQGYLKGMWIVVNSSGRICLQLSGTQREVRMAIDAYIRDYGKEAV